MAAQPPIKGQKTMGTAQFNRHYNAILSIVTTCVIIGIKLLLDRYYGIFTSSE